MKKLVALLLVGGAAFGTWRLCFGAPDFGVDAGNPLGAGVEIARYMEEHELDPGGPASPELLTRFFGEEFAEREDIVSRRFLDRVPGFPHFVVVVYDRIGTVIAVGAQFQSGMREFSTVGPRSMVFSAYYWRAIVGKDPVYTERRWGERDGETYLAADFSGPGVTGQWRKEGPGDRPLPHQTVDRVVFFRR